MILKRISVGLLSLIFCGWTFGQDTPAEKAPDWVPHGNVSLGLQENLYKPRFSAVIYKRPVIVGSASFELPKGFFFQAIGNTGLDDRSAHSHLGTGVDLIAGWKGHVGPVDIKAFANYIDLFPADRFDTKDLVIGSLTLSHTFNLGTWYGTHFLRPEARADYGWDKNFGENAWIFMPSVTYTWKDLFMLKGLSWWQQATWQYNEKIGPFQYGSSMQFSTGVEIPITEHLKIVPGFWYAMPITDAPNRKDVHSFSVNLVYSF